MLSNARELILSSIHLYRKNLKLFSEYMVLLAIPAVISIILMMVLSYTNPAALDRVGVNTLVFLLFYFINIWVSLAFLRVVTARSINQPAGALKDELAFALHRIVPVFFASIVLMLILGAGILLLIFPAFIFFVWYAFTVYEIVIEKKSIGAALKASKALTHGKFWAVLWRLVAPTLFFAIVYVIIEGILEWISGLAFNFMQTESVGFFLVMGLIAILAILIGIFLTPLSVAAPTILYAELKQGKKVIIE